jgi:ribonucleotide monophosphatase NagD (HAD superfamily)
MLGDRLETDILGGQKAGMKTILVETGIDHAESVISKGIQPDLIINNLNELINCWSDLLRGK